MKKCLLFLILFTAMALSSCRTTDESLSLRISSNQMEVLQQLPVNDKGRTKSALYLAPRSIKKEEFNTSALKVLIDSMYSLMVQKSGVGIAANQLGKRLQIFIIEAKSDNPRYKVLGPVPKQLFINPIITKVSDKKKNFWHGCLSAVGKDRGNVATYEWIEYECQNANGEKSTGRLEGFAAVIFQHEFRHLLTGTYLDVAHQFMPKAELDKEVEKGHLPYFEMASDSLPLLISGYTIGETLDDYHHRLNKQK